MAIANLSSCSIKANLTFHSLTLAPNICMSRERAKLVILDTDGPIKYCLQWLNVNGNTVSMDANASAQKLAYSMSSKTRV